MLHQGVKAEIQALGAGVAQYLTQRMGVAFS